jgi:hypothetical protein
LKLICVLFHEFPSSPTPGIDHVSVHLLQRLGSYMLLAIRAIPPLRPFTKSVFANIVNRRDSDSVRLTARTVADVEMWRSVFTVAFDDARWLSISWYIPPYLHRDKSQDHYQWAISKAATADYILFGDAATMDGGHGIGAVACLGQDPIPFAVLAHDLPHLVQYITSTDDLASVHINILESVAAVFGFAALALYLRTLPTPVYPVTCVRPFIHVHIWTDNSAALYWLSKNRSHTPFVNLLYSLFCHLQLMSGVILTMGHIPGAINVFADAVSRDFQVDNGPLIRAQLYRPDSLEWNLSSLWVDSMVKLSTQPSLPTSSHPHVARILAEKLFSVHSV